MGDLSRLLDPRSIAVIGGGAWCSAIIGAARRIGYGGEIFPVHPQGKTIAGLTSLRRLEDRGGPIDAAFIGVNRHATIETVKTLQALGAGGAVCFASGFTEARNEDAGGADLQAALLAAAADMPVLGPNCYGFVNALDRAAIWPDQHGLVPVDRGVAILTQSSNIAINLTMQRRGLPVAMMITCGNMAQQSQAAIAAQLLKDDRITAIGLHIEGFGAPAEWETLAALARARNIPMVALKVGRSEQARSATVSHTASLAGSDAGAQALLDRLGIARVRDIPSFLETLKLMHVVGRLASNRISSISCSGGEASLIADMAVDRNLIFPPLNGAQRSELRDGLGPMVALANPLDYHTYIWRDAKAMTRVWAAMAAPEIAMTLSIVDFPHTDATDWECTIEAARGVCDRTGRPFAVVATLPELMPEDIAGRLLAGGVIPFLGLSEALAAIEAAAPRPEPEPLPLWSAREVPSGAVLDEAAAKQALAGFGLHVPSGGTAEDPVAAARLAQGLRAPLAVKGQGIAHKTEAQAVRLGVLQCDVEQVAREIGTVNVLIEEMVPGAVAELLVGVVRDPAHGFVLTLAAGGVLTEILSDSVSLLLPSSRDAVRSALGKLRIAPLLAGYRGKPAANMDAILDAVDAVQAYVGANLDGVCEVEINPLICTPTDAVAVDALIRKAGI